MGGEDIFHVWSESCGPSRSDHYATIKANDASHAAEEWVRGYEWSHCDFEIANGEESIVVHVRHGVRGEWKRFLVEGDPSPRYTTTEL